MNERDDLISNLPLFAELSADELRTLATLLVDREFDAGEVVFEEGDTGTEMFVVLDGVVEIFAGEAGGPERVAYTARAGTYFGHFSLLDQTVRPARARAVEKTRAVSLDLTGLERLIDECPGAGASILRRLAKDACRRGRDILALYQSTVEWSLRVTGVTDPTIRRLIADHTEITVELVTGNTVEGILLRADTGDAGTELHLDTGGGRTAVVPYDAVAAIFFDEKPQQSAEESALNL